MANVFLSYDREDHARARPIAALLERTGHSVWWDRQIKGGHEFGAEIEAALEAADKIVVLWSQRAIRSAWVRDEAGVGRDTGRLVPVTIDGTPAPLGFRQLQTLDLSTWRGRGSSGEIADLLNALDTGEAAPSKPLSKAEARRLRLGQPALIGAGGIAGLAMAGSLAWELIPAGVGGMPTFAIEAADSSPSSRQLAADVATRVAGLSEGSATDFHVVDGKSRQQESEFALKVGAGSASANRTLSLVSNRNDAIIWSTSVDLGQDNQGGLAQAASVTAQRALSCVADVLSYRREKIDEGTFRLYLAGCTQYDAAYGTNSGNTSLDKIFQDVIAKAPHFVPAWTKLFEVECEDLFAPDPNRDALISTIKAQLERARQLGIDLPEFFAIKANLLSPSDFLGFFRTLDEGIAKHPDNAFLFRLRGERYSYVGRMNQAVSDAADAVRLDPLSPANQEEFASELAYSGDTVAGYAQLRKAEQLWPNSPTVGMARYRMDLRFGDPREAQALYRKYVAETAQNPAQEKFIEARIAPTPANIETALEAERKINRQFPPFIASLEQALGYFGRKDEAIDLLTNYPNGKFHDWIGYNAEVLFRPMMHDVWRDPRAMAGAAHVGLLHYWKASGNWPDFCFDPTLPYDCKKEGAKYQV